MSDKRTHSEILFDLIDRWQKGDVSNRVLIRDLSGMAVNTDHLETANAALEARLSKMERDLAILYIFYGEDIVERLSAKGTLGAANLKALQQERQEALAGERR